MARTRQTIWLFLAIVFGWAAVMLIELATQWPLPEVVDVSSAHRITAGVGRAHNQLLSVVLVSVALAIPITASNYTPKLLRLFLTDRIHVAVLLTYAFAAMHANWLLLLSREGAVSGGLLTSGMITSGIGFALVVPYFFYVIWFLEPTNVVRRIRGDGGEAAQRAVLGGSAQASARAELAETIHNLGTMVLKAVDRMERQTVSAGIFAIREVLAEYGQVKPQLSDDWYQATTTEHRGLSREALQFISADRCWLEIVALIDLNLVFEASLRRMPDAIVSVADTLRGVGVDAYARGDAPVLDNVARALNSMIRSSVTHREPHAIFDVLNQYRALAEECLEGRPQIALDGAVQWSHYALRARQAGLVFIPELFVYDIGALIRFGLDLGLNESVATLMNEQLDLIDRLAPQPSVPLACAALVTLGSTQDDLSEGQRARYLASIGDLPDAVVDAGLGVLERTESPRYHELTARQIDLNFLPPQHVEQVRALVLDARRRGGGQRKAQMESN